MKDFPNILDISRERVAFSIFCVLFFQKYWCDRKTRLVLKYEPDIKYICLLY